MSPLESRGVLPALFFLFFLVSGFCSLVDQVVWLRLAMAQFGVTAPMVSVVLSLFMGGLAIGSLLAPRLARGASPPGLLRRYAATELLIGLSVLVVPAALGLGRRVLAALGAEEAWGSLAHYLAAGVWVGLVILPFCVAMGMTVPLAMDAIRGLSPRQAPFSFSLLYLANVLGAGLGTVVSAFVLIELLGFRGTLAVAAAANVAVAAAALALSGAIRAGGARLAAEAGGAARGAEPVPAGLLLLFLTGLASMGMEVVWVRQFTPYLGSVVYAYAVILATYLAATFAGSTLYRARLRGAGPGAVPLLACLAVAAAALPDLLADPRLGLRTDLEGGALRVALGLAPFCMALGVLTPLLVDRFSGGDGARAGRAYAVNVAGCILGPLLAGFVLLPAMAERWALLALAAPVALLGLGCAERAAARALGLALVAAAVAVVLASRDHETAFARREVLRDYTATVVATGTGLDKRLLVNGIGMTELSPITKMMAHLPLAMRAEPARQVLVVCFGMGTSFRSALSWGVAVTAVELVPSVPRLFGFFHADGPALLREGSARLVVDDGRRFLERTRQSYDLILVDPPPPPEAAGSSLLYSREFYALAGRRLAPGGVLAQWLPGGDRETVASFTRALAASFPSVRAYPSVLDNGVHFLASLSGIAAPAPEAMAARLPPAARADLLEWGPHADAASQLRAVVAHEIPLARLAGLAAVPALSDDRPVNEYYFLRRWRHPTLRRGDPWRFAEEGDR